MIKRMGDRRGATFGSVWVVNIEILLHELWSTTQSGCLPQLRFKDEKSWILDCKLCTAQGIAQGEMDR